MPLKIPTGFADLPREYCPFYTLRRGDIMYKKNSTMEPVTAWDGDNFGEKKHYEFVGVLVPVLNLKRVIEECKANIAISFVKTNGHFNQGFGLKEKSAFPPANDENFIPSPPRGYSTLNGDISKYILKEGNRCYLNGYGWVRKPSYVGNSVENLNKQYDCKIISVAVYTQDLPPRFKCDKPYPFGY